jgi:hypothetical protein
MSGSPSPSDTAPLTELLLELYDTQQAAAYGNLFVGIVFGEHYYYYLCPLEISLTCASAFAHTGAYVVLYGTSLYILL